MNEPVYVGGRRVGHIILDPDGRVCLLKTGLDPMIHKMHRPPGWALENEHLDMLGRYSNGESARIRLLLIDGTKLQAYLDQFDKYGVKVNRGYGEQTLLPDRWWSLGTTQRQMRMEV
jgi:hypothetical protein